MRWLIVLLLAVLLLLGVAAWRLLEPGERDLATAGPTAAGPGAAPAAVEVDRPREGARGPGAEPAVAGGQRVALEGTDAVPVAAEEDGAEPLLRILGRVLDPAGRPLAGATVYGGRAQNWAAPPLDSRAHATNGWANRRQATTGNDGRFALEGLAPGPARLAVRASGCAPYDDDALTLPPQDGAAEHDLGDVQLARGVVLWGRVVDPSGFGVAGAEIVRVDDVQTFFLGVTGKDRGALLATAGADGSFRIDVLAPGPWKLMVISDAHPDGVFEGVTETPEQGGLRFELQAGAAIHGRVEGGGRDPRSVVVRASPPGQLRMKSLSGPMPWRETTCAADGGFVLGGLEPGATYRLRARGEGASPWSTEWLSDPVESRAGARDVSVRLLATAAVTFRVVAAESGEPIAAFRATLVHGRAGGQDEQTFELDDERVSRDPVSGVVTLSGIRRLDAGVETTLRVESSAHLPASTKPFALEDGETRALGTLELARRPMMSVRVVEAATGEPIEGASVQLERLEGEEHEARTDSGGLAELPRIEGADCLLSASAPDHADSPPLSFRLAPGERTEPPSFELALHGGGALEVTVLTPAGAPEPGATVTCAAAAGGASWNGHQVEERGVARFERLSPGRYRVEVDRVEERGLFRFGDDPEAPPESWAEVQVVEGQTTHIALVRPARGALVGRITEGGRALSGAGLRLEATDGQRFTIPGLTDQPQAPTDGGGRYRIDPLNAGPFELVIEHPRRVMEARVEVLVLEGENELDVDLPVTVVEGRVTDADGGPLEGARVDVARAEDGADSNEPQILFQMAGHDNVVVQLGGREDTTARTGADGRYELRGVLADTALVVTASHPARVTASSAPFEIDAGEVRDGVDLSLGSAGRIEAFAERAGAPLGNVVVRATYVVTEGGEDPGVDDVSGHTDGQGRALLDGLTPGAWSVRLEPAGWDEEDYPGGQVVAVAAGEVVRVDLEGP